MLRDKNKQRDILYKNASEYQDIVVDLLKQIFPKNEVKREWDSVYFDNHRGNHKTIYAPRIDVAVGPFNSSSNLRSNRDNTVVMKNSLLVERLNERYDIIWNNSSRCFLAIEVAFSGSSKHIMGDFLNATSTGGIGIVVSGSKSYKKVRRMLNYFKRLEEFKRMERRSMMNLMLFRDVDFLQFLEELKNPEKAIRLKIDAKYKIRFKSKFLIKNFTVPAYPSWVGSNLDRISSQKLLVYGFQAKQLIRSYDIVLGVTKYTLPCIAWFYEIVDNSTNKKIRILDIVDIVVKNDFRNKGIGGKILSIFEDIARKNDCQYIFVELGDDSPEDPLESQKRLFQRNGFKLWYDKRGEFSGWIGKKIL